MFALACAHVEPAGEASSRIVSLKFGGRLRTANFFRPAIEGDLPLVVALHGRFGDGAAQEKLSGLTRVATREGFAVVFPDGVQRSWADARGSSPAARQGVDDVGYLAALIEKLVAEERIDATRVFITGMSNGAMMTLTMVCRRPELFAGAAAVTGLLPLPVDGCRPSRPPSVAIVVGDKDPLVPFDGGAVSKDRGEVASAQATLNHFKGLLGCDGADATVDLPDTAQDGTTTQRYDATGCPEGRDARLYVVRGGGHTWPGGFQYLAERVIGKTSRDFNASDEIWAFFKSKRRDQPSEPNRPTR